MSEVKVVKTDKKEIVIPDERGLGNWLLRLLKGILIGIGAILPGLSGGVLAVIFGVYDHMMVFLSSLTKDFLKRLRYFLPIGIGGVIGILIFSVAVAYAFSSYEPIFVCLFLGFVVGTLPTIFHKAGSEGRGTGEMLSLLLGMLVIIALMLMGGSYLPQLRPSFPVWIGAGFLIGIGVIIPGLSTSNFLMYLGLYEKMAQGVKDLEFTVIIPIMIGVALTVIMLAKGATWLFRHHYSIVYHIIFGLVVGSCIAIVPTIVVPALRQPGLNEMGLTFRVAVVLCVAMFVVGAFLSYLFSLLEKKYET
ncbi:MAG TPA: DUF368 domain-containing protein [Clostridiaceae bacterium]|nr:DUF368 domain-containing protein [Clostridiaceae bacterium]